MSKPFACLNERYCPLLGRNVAVKTQFQESGRTDTCLYYSQCREDRRHCLIHRENKARD